ncbi:MAG: phenylalanine--tRNA ligase subunit alpha, partial [Dehalococcoidia bacterium]
MLKKLDELKSKAVAELRSLQNLKELGDWRVRYLGKKSALTQILRGLSALPVEQRKGVGACANELKAVLERYYREKKEILKQKAYQDLEGTITVEKIDVTLSGHPIPLGRLHPTTQMVREICDIFVSMGFPVVEGPEV